jgi:hypothetical protein
MDLKADGVRRSAGEATTPPLDRPKPTHHGRTELGHRAPTEQAAAARVSVDPLRATDRYRLVMPWSDRL